MKNLVFQTDFGIDDGAVSSMYGVAYTVSPDLKVSDLTHGIDPYDVWQASYRLVQTISYWPAGTVFVSVVDPGVGSSRRSIVARTVTGQYVVTPDNGTITHVWQKPGVDEVRVIDETRNRRPHSEDCYTFHGRDVYAYAGARLAAGVIDFSEVGPPLEKEKVKLLQTAEPELRDGVITGTIDILDVRFGSLWTSIPKTLFQKLGAVYGERMEISIHNGVRMVYSNTMIYGHSFADVYIGEPLLYVNSLDCMAVAINQGSFAKAYNIQTGNNWKITISGCMDRQDRHGGTPNGLRDAASN